MGKFVTRGNIDKMTRQQAEAAANQELEAKIKAGRPSAGDFSAAQAKWAAGGDPDLDERLRAGRPSSEDFEVAEMQFAAGRPRGAGSGEGGLLARIARQRQAEGVSETVAPATPSRPRPTRARAAKTAKAAGTARATKATRVTKATKTTKTTKAVRSAKKVAGRTARAPRRASGR